MARSGCVRGTCCLRSEWSDARTRSTGRFANRLDGSGCPFGFSRLTLANKTPSGHPDPSSRFAVSSRVHAHAGQQNAFRTSRRYSALGTRLPIEPVRSPGEFRVGRRAPKSTARVTRTCHWCGSIVALINSIRVRSSSRIRAQNSGLTQPYRGGGLRNFFMGRPCSVLGTRYSVLGTRYSGLG
jgi:hypothetical protein